MPLYGTLTLPPAAYPGDSVTVINNEKLLVNQSSERVALPPAPGGQGNSISVEVAFAGAPGGAGEFDVACSDTDLDADFVLLPTGGAIAVGTVNANNVARLDINNISARFVRLFNKTVNTNNVFVTAKISVKS